MVYCLWFNNIMFKFEKLEIWKLSINYANKIYQITKDFPKEEIFGVISQLRRSAVSISANIAEGVASESKKEFKLFLNFSLRSLSENVSELVIAKNQNYLSESDFNSLYQDAELLIKKIIMFRKSLDH